MDKKESPNKDTEKPVAAAAETKAKKLGFTGKLAGIFKLLAGICLLPLVYAATVSFINGIGVLDKVIINCFLSGIVSFLFVFIFIYEPTEIFEKGQGYVEAISKFLAPLVKVAGYLLPIFSIIAFVLYLLASPVAKSAELIYYITFVLGFTMTMHLVLCAESLKKKADFLKGNYIFSISFIYLVNVTLLAFFFTILFSQFSFVDFFNNSFRQTIETFYSIFKQLFFSAAHPQ